MLPPASTAESLTRSADFWFSDGSIVAIVGNTAFRIHNSILSKYSEVFADMFTIPQPHDTDGEDFIEGCPVVHFTDDVSDFTDLVRALYEPFYFDTLPSDADLSSIISFVSGILRVSTKYDLRSFRNKCISVLQTKFPPSLKECDALVASGYTYTPSTILRAIALARDTNVPAILPWAFYISINIPVDALLEDAVLSWRDKALCLAGREQLWGMQKTRTHCFLFDLKPVLGCLLPCQSRMVQPMHWRGSEKMRETPYPLHRFDKWDSLKLCVRCLDQAKTEHEQGRKEAWMELPKIFKLGSWEDVEKDQNR